MAVVYLILAVIIELILPGYAAIILAIINCFVPDPVPYLDEIIGLAIGIVKILNGE